MLMLCALRIAMTCRRNKKAPKRFFFGPPAATAGEHSLFKHCKLASRQRMRLLDKRSDRESAATLLPELNFKPKGRRLLSLTTSVAELLCAPLSSSFSSCSSVFFYPSFAACRRLSLLEARNVVPCDTVSAASSERYQ